MQLKSKLIYTCIYIYILDTYMRVFPKMRIPQNRWFIMDNPIKIDIWGVPLFSETLIYIYIYIYVVYVYLEPKRLIFWKIQPIKW